VRPRPGDRSSSGLDGPGGARATLADRLADPLNRFVRYPLARALAPAALKTPLQADHVTFAHFTLGLAAAAMVYDGRSGALPWAMLEARMVLDCLDGVLARARGTSSARGRANDELADATAFLALVLAIAARAHDPRAWLLALALLATAAVTAAGYAVLKRRLLAQPLLDDPREDGPLVRVTRFGDRVATRIFWPSERRPTRPYVAAVSLLSWDNALPIVHLGVLTGAFALAEGAALAYGAIALVATLALGHAARAAGSASHPRAARDRSAS
jgi:phosphatidylglycerophosphate synthase